MKYRGPVDAATFLARLEADPDYVERRRQHEEERQRRRDASAIAQAPIVEALKAASIEAKSTWDLIGRKPFPPAAVKIFLDHLQLPYPDAIREGMARALADPLARPHWPVLVDLYKRETGRRAKDGLADALSELVDSTTFDEMMSLARDTSLGQSRILLLSVLRKAKYEAEALRIVPAFLDDPGVCSGAADILKNVRRRIERRKQRQSEQRTRKSSGQ